MNNVLKAAMGRVSKYIAEREVMTGLDSDHIHGLHVGHETREAVLLLSDLRKLVAELDER